MGNNGGCGCGSKSTKTAQNMPQDIQRFIGNQVRSRSAGASRIGGRSPLDATSESAEERPVTRLDQVRPDGPEGSTLPPVF